MVASSGRGGRSMAVAGWGGGGRGGFGGGGFGGGGGFFGGGGASAAGRRLVMLSTDDRKRIAEAVTEAEAGTTGEITCVPDGTGFPIIAKSRWPGRRWSRSACRRVLVLLDLHHVALGWVGEVSPGQRSAL